MARGAYFTTTKSSAMAFLRSLSPLDKPEAKPLPRNHPLRALGYKWRVEYTVPTTHPNR